MIKAKAAVANHLMALPRNEAGFSALLETIKEHRAYCQEQFEKAARAAVFNPATARDGALVHSGHVAALDDVIDLLERQVDVGK